MRISFDLDDTLICFQDGVPQEPPLPWYLRWLTRDEPLRLGAVDLMHELRRRDSEVWIYTTSNRRPSVVRRWLRFHGVHIDGFINQDSHNAYLRQSRPDRPPSKNPGAFGIDLHVDDSDGVRMEGEQHGFHVVVVTPDEQDWADKVLQAVVDLERR